MGWTKGRLVDQAFTELALAGYTFELDPEERLIALERMDAMLGVWEGKGVCVGYAFASTSLTEADFDADSGLPPMANEPVYVNLAVRLCPVFGKAVPAGTQARAADGYAMLLWNAAQPPQQQLPNTLPRGAGNKPWRRTDRPFMPQPDPSPLGTSPGPGLDILE
jgi:hypothetical protein